jgi:hypothetical protein
MLNPRQKQAAKLMKLAMLNNGSFPLIEMAYSGSENTLDIKVLDVQQGLMFTINMDEPNPDSTLASLINILERMCIDNDHTIGDVVNQTVEDHEL